MKQTRSVLSKAPVPRANWIKWESESDPDCACETAIAESGAAVRRPTRIPRACLLRTKGRCRINSHCAVDGRCDGNRGDHSNACQHGRDPNWIPSINVIKSAAQPNRRRCVRAETQHSARR
jgi:hypothetical protein